MELENSACCPLLSSLLVFLRAHSSVEVRNADSQLLCTFADELAFLGADGMGNLGTVHAVLHHQHFQFADVVDDELLEAGREHVTRLGVGTVADVGHQVLSLEATSDTIVNTFRLAPVLLKYETNSWSWLLDIKHCRPLTFTFTYRSDWWRMNFFVLFLRILGLNAGRTAILTERRRSEIGWD